jgi:hypothetical protein
MEPIDLFEELKEKFPTCFFTSKGRRIIIHDDSCIDGLPAYNFTSFQFPYKVGLNYKLYEYLKEKGWYTEFNKNGELVIKQL